MKRPTLILALAGVLGVIGFAAAGAIAGTGSSQSRATLSLRETKLGKILVNSKGHTLYLFMKDRNGKSSCNGACAKFWPPLVVKGTPTAGPGVKKSLVGETKRSNGSMQVTYNRHPLYAYVLDKKAGQTTGERVLAFGAKWYVVSAKGRAVTKTSTGATTTTTTHSTTTTTYTNPYP
jgi:predicted lipoprotein with Yx(FWY)xxD motif